MKQKEMALSSSSLLLLLLFLISTLTKAFDVPTLSFEEAYSPLFGDGNLVRSSDGKSVRLLLDRYTGREFLLAS